MAKQNAHSRTGKYTVGFAKPPKNTQFTKGTTGNPKGRPKGSKSIASILTDICHEVVKVTVSGKTRHMIKLEAMFMQLSNKAINGDLKAMHMLIDVYQRYLGAREAGELNPQLQALVDALNHGPVL